MNAEIQMKPAGLEGILRVTPTTLMPCFAVLSSTIVMDAGLFELRMREVLAAVGKIRCRSAIPLSSDSALLSAE